jgi:hypothetical protein
MMSLVSMVATRLYIAGYCQYSCGLASWNRAASPSRSYSSGFNRLNGEHWHSYIVFFFERLQFRKRHVFRLGQFAADSSLPVVENSDLDQCRQVLLILISQPARPYYHVIHS